VSSFSIRAADVNDLPGITDIYNDAVLHTAATFDTETKTPEQQKAWFASHGRLHPIRVAEQNGSIIAWASLSRWSDRCAYDLTVEVSVYVHKDFRGKGIGRQLLQAVTHAGKEAGVHCILSRITEGNAVSIHLHEALGYTHIGVMRQAGKKFGKYLDVYMMQKVFE